MSTFDIAILGAGMAGVSLAAALGAEASVVLIEAEDQPGRHATGRSAAMFFETYGNPPVRALARASRAFLTAPPAGFAETRLMTPRATMYVADAAQEAALAAFLEDAKGEMVHGLAKEDALARVPILSPDWLTSAVLDVSGYDMDVAALLQGYLAQARRSGVPVVTGTRFASPERREGGWTLATPGGPVTARTLVNATGAWADVVGAAAGATPQGLRPLRRSAVIVPAPDGADVSSWPIVIDAVESFYFKPDAGQLLLSPANEDPDVPSDVAPDELDVAIAVDRFERATTHRVRRISHRWAGLRTFAADRNPVVGFDPEVQNFFWLCGQGGAGILTAPALARLAAALVLRRPAPEDILAEGLDPKALLPGRPGLKGPPAAH